MSRAEMGGLGERFDAFVSVELHTDAAHDAGATVTYSKRYHAICPERFYIKVPLTPAGFLGARQLAAAGIPVNFKLGFSARQNPRSQVSSQVAVDPPVPLAAGTTPDHFNGRTLWEVPLTFKRPWNISFRRAWTG